MMQTPKLLPPFDDVAFAVPANTGVEPRILAEVYREADARGVRLDIAALIEKARSRSTSMRRVARLEEDRERQSSIDANRSTSAAWRFHRSRRRSTAATLQERTKALVVTAARSAESLRERLFGQREPPFATLEDSAAWVEQRGSVSPPSREPSQGLFTDLAGQARAVDDADPWHGHSVTRRTYVIEYWRPNGGLGHRYVSRDEPSFDVQRWSEKLDQETRIPQASWVAYLLAGLAPGQMVVLSDGRRERMPGLSLVKISVESIGRVLGGEQQLRVTADFDIRDTTDRHFREIRALLSERWPDEASAAVKLRPAQLATVDAVAGLGGPPSTKFDPEFWKRVNDRLPPKFRVGKPVPSLAQRYERAIAARQPKRKPRKAIRER